MTKKINSYQDLIVWQKSVILAKKVYLITKKFPSEERFGLTSQMQRAAVSIASNIAEGYGRGTRKEYRKFLHIALGSNFELQTQITIAKSIFEKIEYNDVEELVIETAEMLRAIIKKLSTNP